MVVTGRLGKAVVELDLDDKAFKRETGQATAGLDSQMKSLQTTVLGVVSALGLVAAAKGAVNMLTTLTKKAIEVADSFEVMEKQLITLTKSEDKARRFFEEIKNFAKDTPYQVRDLAQSFNMLYPIFKDETVPMMKLIGDTAAGTGRSFEDTASAMMRMATGDWGVEIMRQLFLVKSDFGDLFGPNGELVGSQEEAWGRLEEILGDRFGGMMVGMMDTVQGKVSNLKDVLDSLANSVGAELTPITKELLDLLIEVVKQAEESGELQEAAEALAEILAENKDTLADIVDLLPVMVSIVAELLSQFADLVDYLAKLNTAWGDWTGEGVTALEFLKGKIEDVLKSLILVGEVQREISTKGILKADYGEALERARTTYSGVGGEEPEVIVSGGPRSEIDEARWLVKEQGYDARALEIRGFSEEAIAEATGERRTTGAPRRERTTKAKRAKTPAELSFERRKQAERTREALAGLEAYQPTGFGTVEQAGLSPEELEKQREEELEQVRELAEMYAEYLDPTRYIIEGLKSGEMKQAIQDFAVELGTKVAEELLRKLVVMGIMAILNVLTGGGAQGVTRVMGRGGIIRAASGLLATMPAIPGGYIFPWGNDLINMSEAGEAETLGVFPPGRRGQDIITGPLARMFNIPVVPGNVMVNPNIAAPNVNVETRPNNNINITVPNMDPHGIRTAVKVDHGKVNKNVSVRQ
jgi:hypothetical protein